MKDICVQKSSYLYRTITMYYNMPNIKSQIEEKTIEKCFRKNTKF